MNRSLTAFLVFALMIPASLSADWQDDLRRDLRDQGYSKSEIEEAIQDEIKRRKVGNQQSTILPPIIKKPTGNSSQSDRLEAYIERIKALEFDESRFEKVLRTLKRFSTDTKREKYVSRLESEVANKKWLDDELAPLKEKLENAKWPEKEIEGRLEKEGEFFLDHKDIEDNEEYDEKRERFLDEIIEDYLNAAIHQARLRLNDEEQEGLSEEVGDELLYKHESERKSLVKSAIKDVRLKVIQKREKRFKKASVMLVKSIKKIWASKNIPNETRKLREKYIATLCDDLSTCSSKRDFNRMLDDRLRLFKKQSFSADELDIIERDLSREYEGK